MEADWEVEIGPDAPVIEAVWSGFIDLRTKPELVDTLPEIIDQRGLAEVLVSLNGSNSPIWTSKCDAWSIENPEELDPDELNAKADCLVCGQGCYIDLLPKSDQQWETPEMAAHWARVIVSSLRPLQHDCCRIDLIVRKAWITTDLEKHGITAYFTACGAAALTAKENMKTILQAFRDVLLPAQR